MSSLKQFNRLLLTSSLLLIGITFCNITQRNRLPLRLLGLASLFVSLIHPISRSYNGSFDLEFLYGALKGAMGCFFGCFRSKDDSNKSHFQTHLVSDQADLNNNREAVKPRNRLSSLLLSEDGEASLIKDEESHGFGTPQPYNIDKGLKDEARFLKGCGVIPETPAEIRKAAQFNDSSLSTDSDSSTFHSWLPNTSITKLQLDYEPDQPPTPTQVFEDCGVGGGSDITPSSCVSNSQKTGMSGTSFEGRGPDSLTSIQPRSNPSVENLTPVSPSPPATIVQHRNRSVRFQCDFEEALLSSGSSSSGNHGVQKSKHSPFATPLELNDEMQTPGTVFPASLDYTQNRKNARIRAQYVYSALNPGVSFSQWNKVKEADSDGCKDAKLLTVDTSLVPTLVLPTENPYFGKTPGDRPILGTVAAHWNGEESYISPKMWDGNGIPNSTNKYKEDQKVSWHATPFEERLEKALSEESYVFQRKDLNETAMNLEEVNEENDTAASHL